MLGAVGGIDTWADSDLPRIRFIATGGTIATRGGTRMSAEEVLQLVPGLQRHARPEPEQFANVASTAMTLDQWVQLARRVNDLFDHDPGLTAAVITSGTDSLEELAYFLHLTVKTTKPVVLVGAMRNAGALGYEGPANLLDAFRVAAAADSRNKGVLVVLNDEINSAREVAKTDALRVQTFQSRPYGILGVVDPDRVVYYRDPVKRHTERTEFDISTVTSLPRVDIMMFYQGASSDLLRAAVDAGAKGIVIAVAGADLTGGSLGPGINVRRTAGCRRRGGNENGQRPHCRTIREPRARRDDRRRRSHAAEGAHPVDAGVDEDPVARRHPADVHGVLKPTRCDGRARCRRPRRCSPCPSGAASQFP